MLWEDMNSEEFVKACKDTKGTCILPFGVIEKHGTHLPLCTDMLIGRQIALEAVKIESAVVFPYYYFGQIAEARHTPGTIAICPELIYALFDEVLKEISRNGFKKIVILGSHGGNEALISYYMQSSLYERKDFIIYYINYNNLFSKGEKEEILAILDRKVLADHAGTFETSFVMAERPELVHMDNIEQEGLKNYEKLKHLKEIRTPIDWYAAHPTHQAGDPSNASSEAGKKILSYAVANVAKAIKAIKEDLTASYLLNEFYGKCHQGD